MYKTLYIRPGVQEKEWKKFEKIASKLNMTPARVIMVLVRSLLNSLKEETDKLPESVKVTAIIPLTRRKK